VQRQSVISELSSEKRHRDISLVHSIAWTGGVKWAVQILTWVATLVVARLLSPADYGLVAMASIYLGLVTLINEFGLETAIITLPDLTDEQLGQINGLAVLLGVISFAFSCIVAFPIGWFFKTAELPSVVIIMSATFIITGFRTVPSALLTKELQFKRLALIEAGQASVLALSMVVFAVMGLGYWTLVLGRLLGELLLTGLVVLARPYWLGIPRLASLQNTISISRHIVVARISWYVYSNADFLVAGRILGQAALGAYTFGWTLANVPIEKVTALVGRVTPAFFSAVQRDHFSLQRYLLRITEGLALLTFPATFGLALVADEFVEIVLGETWSSVVAPLRILAFYASFRSIVTLLPQVLNVLNETQFSMWNGVVAAIVLPITFYIGSGWGTIGIAAGWLAVHPLVTLPLYWRVFQKINLASREYLRALQPAIFGSILMAVTILILRAALPAGLYLPIRFIVQILGGGLAYVAVMLLLCRDRLHAFYRLFNTSPVKR
jgi:PST family polysaccharide transporter